MCDDEELPTSAGEELKIFAETTSLVGLAHVVGDRQRWARIFWALAFMGALAAALYQVAYLILKYRRFEVATEISYQTAKHQTFPIITICNLNPVQERKIAENEDLLRLYNYYLYPDAFNKTQEAEIFGEEEEYDPSKDPDCLKWGFNYNQQANSNVDSDADPDADSDADPDADPDVDPDAGLDGGNNYEYNYDYGYEDKDYEIDTEYLSPEELEEYERCRPKEPLATDEKAKSLLREKLATMKYAALANLSQTREEMIISCVFSGSKCSPSDFGYFPSERYGRCLQFPQSGPRVSRFTGPAAGMELLLFLNTDEYTFSSNVGARIELHPPKTSAYPYENGFYVSAGSMTSISIRKLTLSRKGKPYGECINITDKTDLITNYPHINRLVEKFDLKTYSVQNCESICLYESIKENCICRERVTPYAGDDEEKKNFIYCQTKDSKCVHSVKKDFKTKFSCGALGFPDVEAEQCPNACSEITYTSEISTAHYPSDKNYFEVAEKLMKNEATRLIFSLPDEARRKTLSKSWYKDNEYWNAEETDKFESKVRHNLVRLRIFYKLLNYELIKEKPNYEFINLVSDLGGNTGLWIGFCVLTVVEWIVLIVNLAFVCCCKIGKSGRTSPVNDENYKTAVL